MTPTKTPVGLPASPVASTPALSSASQAVSSSRRCWGSMARASRGLIPKNSASNQAASCRNPPFPSVSQPRSVGKPPMASTPSATSCHSSAGVVTPPG